MTSLIATMLWPGIKKIVGDDAVLAGITVNKGGYHSTRNWLKSNEPNDYSIQLPADKLGPGDEGAAIDVTFKTAQRGNYSNIAKYSKRLYAAGQRNDPRTYPLREFQGNIDSDTTVEGWSFYRDHSLTSSDKSHLWHIHQSIWRKYVNNADAMKAILSIWRGESLATWRGDEEEDMAITTEDAQKIAKAVWALQVIAPPADADADPGQKWSAAGALGFVTQKTDNIEDYVKPEPVPTPPAPTP